MLKEKYKVRVFKLLKPLTKICWRIWIFNTKPLVYAATLAVNVGIVQTLSFSFSDWKTTSAIHPGIYSFADLNFSNSSVVNLFLIT